jgi:methyl-accepting chemotaxis protein
MACEAKFKYVCEYKKKLDAIESSIEDFSGNFITRYIKYEKDVNRVINTGRDLDKIVNTNYAVYKGVMAQLETLKNEISKNMNENSNIMEKMDSNINQSKKVLGGVSEKMNSLSDRASGSHQSYKNELGMYRRDVFSILAFLCAGSGIYYSAYAIFADNS